MEFEEEKAAIRNAENCEQLVENLAEYCYIIGKAFASGEATTPGTHVDEGRYLFWERLRELVGDDKPESKTIGENEVYEGMRVILVNNRDDKGIPIGEKGTITVPDRDGAPGVTWDNPEYNPIDGRSRDIKPSFTYMAIEDLEQISDEE